MTSMPIEKAGSHVTVVFKNGVTDTWGTKCFTD